MRLRPRDVVVDGPEVRHGDLAQVLLVEVGVRTAVVLGLLDVDGAVLLGRPNPEAQESADADTCHGGHHGKGRRHALHPVVRGRLPELERALDGGELHHAEDDEEQQLPRRKRDDLPRAARQLTAPPPGGGASRRSSSRAL